MEEHGVKYQMSLVYDNPAVDSRMLFKYCDNHPLDSEYFAPEKGEFPVDS